MLRRFSSLLLKDMRMIARNYYLAAVLVLAAILIAAIRFLMPAEAGFKPVVLLWDNTSGGAVRQLFEARAGVEAGTLIVVEDSQAYEEELAVPGSRIGIRADGGATVERFELTFQGHEDERSRRLLAATVRQYAAVLGDAPGEYPTFGTRVLEPERVIPRPPFNLFMVPMAVLLESTMVGMFLAAALLYSEKEDRTLRAYRISPGGVAEYLLARCVAMGLLGLMSAVPITLFTVGPGANWPVVVPVVLLAAAVVTAMAMVLANFFETIGQFIYPAMGLLTILTFPSVSYQMPSFGPAWIRFLPTYPLVFALREAYFPTGNSALLSGSIGQLLLTAAVVFPLAVLTFRRQLVARDV